MTVDIQVAFDLLMQIFVVTAPIGLVWAVLTRIYRAFVDMVTGKDAIRL